MHRWLRNMQSGIFQCKWKAQSIQWGVEPYIYPNMDKRAGLAWMLCIEGGKGGTQAQLCLALKYFSCTWLEPFFVHSVQWIFCALCWLHFISLLLYSWEAFTILRLEIKQGSNNLIKLVLHVIYISYFMLYIKFLYILNPCIRIRLRIIWCLSEMWLFIHNSNKTAVSCFY